MTTKAKRRPAGLTIRTFQMADYPAVVQLWELGGLGVDSKEEVRRRLGRDRELFLVAEIEGQPIGTVIGGWDGRRGSAWRLAVHPDYQRRRVAQALLRELEARLKAKGATGLFLVTWHENLPAINLYTGLGYTSHPGVLFMYKNFADESE